VKVYEGCGHGFAVRADPKKIAENEAAEKAADQAVEWFRRFLGRDGS
jgi:dienelactone hydrolase